MSKTELIIYIIIGISLIILLGITILVWDRIEIYNDKTNNNRNNKHNHNSLDNKRKRKSR